MTAGFDQTAEFCPILPDSTKLIPSRQLANLFLQGSINQVGNIIKIIIHF